MSEKQPRIQSTTESLPNPKENIAELARELAGEITDWANQEGNSIPPNEETAAAFLSLATLYFQYEDDTQRINSTDSALKHCIKIGKELSLQLIKRIDHNTSPIAKRVLTFLIHTYQLKTINPDINTAELRALLEKSQVDTPISSVQDERGGGIDYLNVLAQTQLILLPERAGELITTHLEPHHHNTPFPELPLTSKLHLADILARQSQP